MTKNTEENNVMVISRSDHELLIENNKQRQSTLDMIQTAVEGGADVQTLEKLMDLRDRFEKSEAFKAYHAAMTRFKSNLLVVVKDQHVRYQTKTGITEYFHATLANALNIITPKLSENGLSVGWFHSQNEKGELSVTCKITHILGHSESTTMTAAPDTSGGKNSIQAIGSTNSYLERYTVLALAGIATSDMDDDGRGAGGPVQEKHQSVVQRKSENKKDTILATESQQKMITRKLEKASISAIDFCLYFKIDCIASLPKNKVNDALKAIDENKIKEFELESKPLPDDLDAPEKSW